MDRPENIIPVNSNQSSDGGTSEQYYENHFLEGN